MHQLSKDLDVPGNLETGALHGLAQTGAGIMGIAGKLANPSGDPSNERPWFRDTKNWLDQHSQNTGTDTATNVEQKLGYAGETLTEFMLGDEALKGLSQADKLGTVSKFMKIAEGSPRLLQALRTGADVEKVGADAGLSPEAIQFVRSNPTLAKFLNIGMNAARTGATQGTQTLVRSGGDVKQAATDAALTAGTGAVLGTVAHGVAGVLRKGGKAAQTISQMNDVAAGAPTAAGVESSLGKTVNDAFTNETGTLQNNLNDANSTIGRFGEGAPGQQAITQAAQKAAKVGKQGVHDAYQAGLDHLVEMSGDHTIPYENSPLHKAAQEIQSATPETAGPLDRAFNVAQPGSPKANALIDHLADPTLGATAEGGSEPSGLLDANGKPIESTPQGAEPAELDMQHLVARRQSLSNLIRNLGPSDRADRAVYSKLLDGIDDTISKLADGVQGKGEEGVAEVGEGEEAPKTAARQHFDQMNAAYRQGIRPFQNRDVKNILSGNLNDVAKSIMGGQTSLADINDVKQALGPDNFQTVARTSLQNIVQSFTDQSGELDYKKLFSKMSKMNPDVQNAMFGSQGQALSAALKVANDSSNGLSEIGKQVNGLLGNGKIDTLLKDPARVKQIANAVGPDGMKVLGRSILDNQIKQASTVLDKATGTVKASNFDPDKVLDWWMSMKDSPEVRDAFFTADKDSAKQYNEMMQNLAQASSVKKLVKYGVLPLTMGTAAGVVHGPGAALFGALAGLGTEAGFGRARDILDSIANDPRTWKALSFGQKVADKTSKALTQPVRDVGTAAIYQGAKNALSGSQ